MVPALAMREGTTGTEEGKEKRTGPRAVHSVPPSGATPWLILKAKKYQPFCT